MEYSAEILARANSSELIDVDLDINNGDRNKQDNVRQNYNYCESDIDRLRLFDRALDDVGKGPFQYILFSLASIAFFVESAEISVISLLYPDFLQDFGIIETELSIIPSYTAIGMLLGSMIFGQLSDIKGRKYIFQISLAWCVVFGFISSYARTVHEFAFWRLLLGVGYGGNLVCAPPLLLESVPSSSRGLFSALEGIGWFIGSSFSILLVYLYLETKGWAWIIKVISLMGIPAIIGLFFYAPESIRFLILRQRYEDAMKAFEKICEANSKPVPEYFTLENLKGIPNQQSHDNLSSKTRVKQLLSGRIFRTLVPLTMIWFTQSFGSSIFSFLPLFLAQRSKQDDIIFSAAFAVQTGDLIGTLIVIFLTHNAPRISELKYSMLVVGVSVIAIGILVEHPQILFPVLAIAKGALQPMYHALYTYSPEVFPTEIRSTGFSICQFFHRLAPISAPYAVTSLNTQSFQLSTGIFGFLFILASLQTLLLQTETAGSLMVENAKQPDYNKAELVPDLEVEECPQDTEAPKKSFTCMSLHEFDGLSTSSLSRHSTENSLAVA